MQQFRFRLFLLVVMLLVFTAPGARAQDAATSSASRADPGELDGQRPGAEPAPSSRRVEPSSRGARVELGILGSLAGASAGVLSCAAANCLEARPWVGAALAGGAIAGSAIGVAVRRRGLEWSTAQAIEGGALFGALPALYGALIKNDRISDGALFGGLLAGELMGAGLGAALERTLRPSSGSVALANSGGLWLPFVVVLPQLAADWDDDGDTDRRVRWIGGTMLAAQALGLGFGGLLGARDEVERWQVWLADAGALMGAGVAPMLGWLVAGDGTSGAALLVSSALGAGLGFTTGYLLATRIPRRRGRETRGRADGLPLRLGAAPARGGGMLSVSANW